MLPDDFLQLLTAFVDGELSQRQHKAVMRLLHKSSEARAILKQLQENAHLLKKTPRHKLEPSLVDEILQAVAAQKAVPAPQRPRPRSSRRPWLPYVAASLAAALLIAAVGLAYWKSMIDPNGSTLVDNKNRHEKKIEPKPKPDPDATPKKTQPEPSSLPFEIASDVARSFGTPFTKTPDFSAKIHEFNNPVVIDRFSSEVDRKNRLIQLDVTVKNNSIAMERLKAALGERGIAVLADPSASKDLKANAKREYWVYAENLSNAELTRLMQDLAKADTSGQGKTVPTPYDRVKLTGITDKETRKMAGLLGVTGDPVAVPKNAKNASTPPERWARKAIVLPAAPAKKQSAEIRQFLSERQRPTAGAVQVLIKIRHQ